MIKFVFLDLDDTILNFAAGEANALSHALSEIGIQPTQAILDRYHLINLAHWELLEEGRLTREEVMVQRYEQLFRELGVSHSGAAINDRYEYLLSQQHEFIPGAEQLLKELAPRYALYLASNGAAAVQESRIAASGIDRYMDGIYISEKVGAAKPSAKLFEHAFRDLGITNKSRVLMVGDDLLADIKGGLNAGVDTCWFNPGNLENKSGITPKYTVSSYEELYRIVMEPEELENIGVRNRRHSNEALL